jgi:uncharacterized protein
MAKFELFKDKRGEFRWRFISSNGKIIAMSSESYKAKADCQRGIELVKNDGPTAKVETKS